MQSSSAKKSNFEHMHWRAQQLMSEEQCVQEGPAPAGTLNLKLSTDASPKLGNFSYRDLYDSIVDGSTSGRYVACPFFMGVKMSAHPGKVLCCTCTHKKLLDPSFTCIFYSAFPTPLYANYSLDRILYSTENVYVNKNHSVEPVNRSCPRDYLREKINMIDKVLCAPNCPMGKGDSDEKGVRQILRMKRMTLMIMMI